MAHKQTDIRNALVSLLTGSAPTYATDAEDRVYKNRVHNLQAVKLPAIIIRDGSETAVPRDNRATSYIRTWTLNIEVYREAATDYDTALDAIVLQVENLISANRTLGGLAIDIRYAGSEPDYDGSGSKPIGVRTLNYNIQYTY